MCGAELSLHKGLSAGLCSLVLKYRDLGEGVPSLGSSWFSGSGDSARGVLRPRRVLSAGEIVSHVIGSLRTLCAGLWLRPLALAAD